MIKIQDYNEEKGKIMFEADMSIGLANAIRRSALEIPIMAIDEVEIIKNDSALFDEILAHRIGMVPIKTDKVSTKELQFKLKKKGPCTVYSTDFEPSIGVDFKLPLVILGEGQELELNVYAKPGKGIEHIKHSPGLIYYKHKLEEELLSLVSIDDTGKLEFDEEELKEKGIDEGIINKLKKISKVEELTFNIESWGQLEVKEIFTKAIESLIKNLEELNKAVK